MNLIIANTGIKQDEQGRYCLNDLHRAAGGEAKHKPSEWLRNKQTLELIEELTISGIPAIQSKQQLGTFVAKHLVYAYAMWISPSFHLKVINTFDAVVTRPQVDPMELLRDPGAMRHLLLTYTEKVMSLENKIDHLTPKADIADRLTGADGWLCIREAAKALKMQERKLVIWLLEHKWLYRDMKGKLRGYSDKTPRYIDHKVTPIPTAEDSDKVSLQAMITPAGLTRLADIFNVEAEVYREVA